MTGELPRPRRGRTFVLAAAAASLAIAVYVNALHNPFVYDDYRTVQNNGSLVSLRDWRSVVLHDATRPLANVSFALDRRVWGPAPFGFHLTNVVLHAVNVTLFFTLVLAILGDDRARRAARGRVPAFDHPRAVAFAAAALFAVHPVMTEAVGYISGRSEVLSTTFFLVAVLLARAWMVGFGAGWWLAAVAAWTAAALTKETAVTLPLVAFAYDRLLLTDAATDRRRRLWRLHLPWILGVGLVVAVRVAVFARIEHPGDLVFDWRSIFDELDVVRRYLVLLVLPTGQSVFHEIHPISTIASWTALAGMATVGAIAGAAWRLRRADAVASFGFWWFLILLAPSAALVVVGAGEGMVEHRLYLASLGVFLAGATAASRFFAVIAPAGAMVRGLATAVGVVMLLSLSGRAILRNAIWSSPLSLWEEAAQLAPGSWLPHTVLGESLHAVGRHAEAAAEFQQAIRIRPAEDLGYLKLAICQSEMGRIDEARATLDTLYRLNPQSPNVPTGLGIVAFAAGDIEEARRQFQQSLTLRARDPMPLQWIALIDEQIDHDPAAALKVCQEIQTIVPGDLGNDECIRRNAASLAAAPAK